MSALDRMDQIRLQMEFLEKISKKVKTTSYNAKIKKCMDLLAVNYLLALDNLIKDLEGCPPVPTPVPKQFQEESPFKSVGVVTHELGRGTRIDNDYNSDRRRPWWNFWR